MPFVTFALVLVAALPWYAPPSVDVLTKSITFSNKCATLHGTLYLPLTNHPVPVVVYHGAAEPLANTPLYMHLSRGLPQLGIAVLLFDRRGSGASSGTNNVSYETLADDGIAGANALRVMPQVDAARVGYLGNQSRRLARNVRGGSRLPRGICCRRVCTAHYSGGADGVRRFKPSLRAGLRACRY